MDIAETGLPRIDVVVPKEDVWSCPVHELHPMWYNQYIPEQDCCGLLSIEGARNEAEYIHLSLSRGDMPLPLRVIFRRKPGDVPTSWVVHDLRIPEWGSSTREMSAPVAKLEGALYVDIKAGFPAINELMNTGFSEALGCYLTHGKPGATEPKTVDTGLMQYTSFDAGSSYAEAELMANTGMSPIEEAFLAPAPFTPTQVFPKFPLTGTSAKTVPIPHMYTATPSLGNTNSAFAQIYFDQIYNKYVEESLSVYGRASERKLAGDAHMLIKDYLGRCVQDGTWKFVAEDKLTPTRPLIVSDLKGKILLDSPYLQVLSGGLFTPNSFILKLWRDRNGVRLYKETDAQRVLSMVTEITEELLEGRSDKVTLTMTTNRTSDVWSVQEVVLRLRTPFYGVNL